MADPAEVLAVTSNKCHGIPHIAVGLQRYKSAAGTTYIHRYIH